jgi:hypothetical protein
LLKRYARASVPQNNVNGQFTIGQLMILIAVVGLILGIAARASSWNHGKVLLVALVSFIVLGPIRIQLYAIFLRGKRSRNKPIECNG